MNLWPYTFTGAFSRCYFNRQMAMDERHVFIVHEILRSWPFRNALELGSYWGASSTAFVQTINAGSAMTATFCDVNITDGLMAVADSCLRQDQIKLTPTPSWRVLQSLQDYDFILVDANHDMASVRKEVDELMRRRPVCVMAHDTNATAAGYPAAEGAEMLKKEFSRCYHCIEDCEDRPGEETSRGLFLATTNNELFELAKGAFAKWST